MFNEKNFMEVGLVWDNDATGAIDKTFVNSVIWKLV